MNFQLIAFNTAIEIKCIEKQKKKKKLMERIHFMSYLFINHTDWESIEVIICCFEFILCCLYDEMVNKCVAPKCKYNYDSERRKRNEQPVEKRTGIFEFPSHQHQPECRRRWIARVPRKDWETLVNQKIFICE